MKPGTMDIPDASRTSTRPSDVARLSRFSPTARMRSPLIRISGAPSAAGANTWPPRTSVNVGSRSPVTRRDRKRPRRDAATASCPGEPRDDARDQRGAWHEAAELDALGLAADVVAQRAHRVEDGNAERGGEAAVRAAHLLDRLDVDADLAPHLGREREQRLRP